MRLTKTVFILCCLFCLEIGAHAAGKHTVKGVVITPEGTVVPEFSVRLRQVADKPEMVHRKHCNNGEFTIDGLEAGKYELQISSPSFIHAKSFFDLNSQSRLRDYTIVVLHPYRSEARLTPGAAHSVAPRILQQKIPDAAREAYLKGVEFHREGRLNEALIEYGKALRGYPRYLEALTDIGAIFLLYNRPQAALAFLRRAKDVDESNPIIDLNLAVALVEQSNHGGALKLLKKILDREPGMAAAHYFIGKIHYSEKKYDQAETYVRQALDNDPKMLDAWLLMISISLEQQKYDRAREALQRIREAMSDRMVTEFIDEQLSALGS